MQQIGVALSKRLADHTHYSSGLGGDTLSHLTQDRTKQGEWDGDEFINHSIYSEIILSQDWGPTVAETMDHRYEGFKIALTDDMNIAGIMVFLGQSAAITNNPLMNAQIWTDVAGSPGALVGTFNEIPVYPACTKYAGTPPSAWATFVYNGAAWFDPPFSGNYWIILDRSATAPAGGNIEIGRTGTGTNEWVWSDNAVAWTTENNKGGVVMLLGYTQPAAFLTSWLSAGLYIVNQYGGTGINCLCYGGGDAVSGTSYEGYGGYFESVNNIGLYGISNFGIGIYGYSTLNYGIKAVGNYGVSIQTLAVNNQTILSAYNSAVQIATLATTGTGHGYFAIRDNAGNIQALLSGNDVSYSKLSFVAGSNTITACAVLEGASTTKGFLPPRMTTAQRNAIAGPVAGLLIWNTDTTQLEDYNGAAWGAV